MSYTRFHAKWWTSTGFWTSGTFEAPTALDVHNIIALSRGSHVTVTEVTT